MHGINLDCFSQTIAFSPSRKLSGNNMQSSYKFVAATFFMITVSVIGSARATSLCRTSCGNIPISYPFGIDDGCGSPYYRHILACSSDSSKLELRTPSGRYPVRNISYTDPHILVTDPFMWTCQDADNFRPTRPFSLDTSIHYLSLSSQNDYLFFNCSESHIIVEPKPLYCEHFPEKCDSSCDSASYLCRHLPECADSRLNIGVSCCSYYPKAAESLRLMLKYCVGYTSVYWKKIGVSPYDQVPEYGIRIDFDLPVTTRCLECQDLRNGGGACGFDTQTQGFSCLCGKRNVTTTNCKSDDDREGHGKVGVIAGTASAVSVCGALGIGIGVWYLRRVRANAPVACGVQNNENRLF